MTTPSTVAPDDIVGAALYFEFFKYNPSEDGDATKGSIYQCSQMFITPEFSSSPMIMFRRTLTTLGPRRNWRSNASGSMISSVVTPSTTRVDWSNVLDTVFPALNVIIERHVNSGWIARDLIAVEVTADDIATARMGKLPYKAMSRVNKSRAALGLDKKFIGPGLKVA